MTSLYQITGSLLDMRNQMSEAAFDDQTIADTLDGEAGDFDEKVVRTMMVCDELGSDIDAINAHIKRLSDRKKRIESNRDALKRRVMESMKVIGRKSIRHELMTVTLYPERDESIEILDADALPVECLKIIPASSEPIKTKVKEYLQSLSADAAAAFAGARIVKKDRLEIKV